jgi:predicted nucleic acid-binding protein
MKVFLDTNILLDVLARREPFYEPAARLWTLVEGGNLTGLVSVLSLPNLYYILRRQKNVSSARKAVALLRDIFTLVPLDVQILNQGLDSDISDFEDALQYFAAQRAGASVLITRNAKDFPDHPLPIQAPEAFLATHFSDK